MVYFCPSCGSSNTTKIPTGGTKRKKCNACQKEFLASARNRMIRFDNNKPSAQELHSSHVFYKAEKVCGIFTHSGWEKCVLFGAAVIGLILIISALISGIVTG